MSNVKIKSVLKSDDMRVVADGLVGIKKGNVIEYQEDIYKMIVYIDKRNNEVTLKRICDEYYIVMNFALDTKMEGSYYINKVDTVLPLYITASTITLKPGFIYIRYKQELNNEITNMVLTILYEVIE